LQQSALQIIPVETLKNNATENLRKIQKQIQAGKYLDNEPHLESLVIMELAKWFKENFFRWINKLPCTVCGDENTELLRSESRNGVRLEVEKCELYKCSRILSFFFSLP
jgi:peptide-N4-(N-acetyl-beta-glucosaminyl)asparagine amidase